MQKQESVPQIDFFEYLDSAPQQLNAQIQTNLDLRMKYPTQTDKFYSSEQRIDQILQKFSQKLQQTQQQPLKVISTILNSKILVPMLKTLQHPNLDINISAVNCFYSLTVQMNEQIEQAEKDEQHGHKPKQRSKEGGKNASPDGEAAFTLFFRGNLWMVENGLVESLVKVVLRVDQQSIQEYEACRKVLKIIQFLLELSDTVYPIIIRDTGLIGYMANRIMPNFTVSHKIIDDNKFIVSDILLSLLETPQIEQNLSAVREFYKSCGVQVIIETVSSYENKLPTQLDQKQYLMNLFNCLNVLLVSIKSSRQQFHSMKGSYLMISYICIKSQYAPNALKSLSTSLDIESPQTCQAISQEIVNDGSLKYIFPILMMQGLKGQDNEQQQEINEHVLRIVYFLLRFSEGVARDRVLWKFQEKRWEKLERVFEIRIENMVGNEKDKIEVSAQEYIKMISATGLIIVQLCDKIIATLWSIQPKAKQKILALFKLYSFKAEDIKTVLERQYKFIDQGRQKDYIARLLATAVREMEYGIVQK